MQFIVGNSGGKSETLSLEDLIAKERHLVIEGPPGSGKTTSLRLAAKRLIDTARLIVIAPASMYRGERLEEFLAKSLSRQALDINLDAGFFELIRQGPIVAFFDGLDECPGEYQESLFGEIRRVAWSYQGTRIISSSRDPAHGKRLGFAQATVLPLDESRVRSLLRLDGDTGSHLFDQLQKNLGSFLGTPLAVKMVSALLMSQQKIPRNRSDLYREFLRLLFERDCVKKPSGLSFESMLRIGSMLASRFGDRGEVAVSWSRFLDMCDDILEELALEQKYDIDTMNAETLAEKLALSSWMRRDYTTVSFVHTSVEEFLASEGLSFEAVQRLASNPRSHEVVAFWISSSSPDQVEGFLKELLPVDLELIGKCWRNGTQVPNIKLADYLACFRDALSTISKVHLPSIFGGQEVSVFGSVQGSHIAYAVILSGAVSGITSPSKLFDRVHSGGYIRVRKRERMLEIPPTIAAYREMLDLLEKSMDDMKAVLGAEDRPLHADESGERLFTDTEFMEYLAAANLDFSAVAQSVAPTLVSRMRRPGDVEGYFAEENGRRVFVCHDSDRGAGPKVVSKIAEGEQWGNMRLDVDDLVGQDVRKYVLGWIRSEIQRLLLGFREEERWHK